MAQQHLDPTDPMAAAVTGDALAGYLRAQATEFLRALRMHRETGGGTAGGGSEESVDAARALRRSARRISASLHTFRPLLDTDWSEAIRPELAWLSGTLAMEHAYAARLERLLLALHRLSGAAVLPAQTGWPACPVRRPCPAGAGLRGAVPPMRPRAAVAPAPAHRKGSLLRPVPRPTRRPPRNAAT